MTLSKVETFEHDIADEILKKEASVAKIAAADTLVSDVREQTREVPSVSPAAITLLTVAGIVVVLGVLGYFGYNYLTKETPEAKAAVPATRVPPEQNMAKFFETNFPDLGGSLGRFVTKAERTPYGFLITITEYAPVFSFVVKNEDLFATSIAKALSVPVSGVDPFVFSDVTIANNNMRLGTSGSSTIAYAFIGTNKLILSTSTEGIATASAIIK